MTDGWDDLVVRVVREEDRIHISQRRGVIVLNLRSWLEVKDEVDRQLKDQAAARHGTQYSYRMRGCRCETCRAWRNTSQQAYNDRRRLREPSWRPGRNRAWLAARSRGKETKQ